nr:hypothetical protein [Tanacetum cinerariifolium]
FFQFFFQIKVNGVTDDALRLYLFPHSLTHHATAWFDRLPRNFITTFKQMAKMFLQKYFPPSMTKLRNEITNFYQRPDESLFKAWKRYKLSINRCPNQNMLPVTQIDTFYNGLTLRHRDTINAAAGGTFMKRRPEECYDLIKNMTAQYNDWDTSIQRSESSSSITSSLDPKIVALKAEMAKINKNLVKVLQINQQNVYAAGAYNQGGNSYQPQGNRNLISYRSNNYLRPPGFNQNQNQSNPNQNYQNRNQGNNHGNVQRNNQGRNQFFQGASHGQNPPPAYQAPTYQASGYQALVHQASIPQPLVVTTTKFTNYMKANIGLALIDVYEGELTLRVGNKAVTFNLDQTLRYSANYDDGSINRIDVIDLACKEYSQEVLGFFVSGNPTPSTEPSISISSPTLTPFGYS